MTELHRLGAAEAAALIRQKALSPVELTKHLLDRIRRFDPRLAAFIARDEEAAMAAARQAEAALTSGASLGPLHGVPFAAKDIFDAEGYPTTCHSRLPERRPAAADAESVRRLKAAGAILLGKLATHEFALGGPAFDLPFPPARNPWNPAMAPGGSSSGSGVAVAAGFVPAALGSDTSGSIRNPATLCGVVGMKPTYGRVSRRGVFPLSFSLDHVGPLTRTVADSALLLGVLAGHDPAGPGGADRPVPELAGSIEAGVKGLRIGIIRHFHETDMPAHPDVAAAIEAALGLWREAGAEIVEIATAPLQDYNACTRIIMLSEAAAIHRRWLRERPQDYSAATRDRLLPGLFMSSVDYVQALRWRARLVADMERAMGAVDVTVAASAMDPPFLMDDPAEVAKYYPRHARAPFNLTGQPALAIPAGFTADGLPLGLQIVGRPWQEAMLYRVARAYERMTDWQEREPLLAA